MTIKNLRNFIKNYSKLINKQGINKRGKYFTKYNILDVCGFIHQKICAYTKYAKSTQEMIEPLKRWLYQIINQIDQDQVIYLVFDPVVKFKRDKPFMKIRQLKMIDTAPLVIEHQAEPQAEPQTQLQAEPVSQPEPQTQLQTEPSTTLINPFKQIKDEETKRRKMQNGVINGYTISQICDIKKMIYYYFKECIEEDIKNGINRDNIKIILSYQEADIMVGSLIRKIQKENNILPGSILHGVNKDITVISTDCDMFVVGYGYYIQDGETITDTVKFFQLFGLDGMKQVAAVPQYLGCDYCPSISDDDKQCKSKQVELLGNFDMLFNNSQFYHIFMNPDVVEDDYELCHTKNDWRQVIDNIMNEIMGQHEQCQVQCNEQDMLDKINQLEDSSQDDVRDDQQDGQRDDSQDDSQDGPQGDVRDCQRDNSQDCSQ